MRTMLPFIIICFGTAITLTLHHRRKKAQREQLALRYSGEEYEAL